MAEDERVILDLKDTLEKTEEEIVEKDKRLIELLEDDSAKNDMIAALKERVERLEEENAALSQAGAGVATQISNTDSLTLADKNKKIAYLMGRLKEAERKLAENGALAGHLAGSSDRKNMLLVEFNAAIENLKKENESLKVSIVKKDNAVLDLIAEHKEKDKYLETLEKKNEFLLRKLKEPKATEDSNRLKILLQGMDDKNRVVTHLSNLIKEKDRELADRDSIIDTLNKQIDEKQKLIIRLGAELERGHEFNKNLFKEASELRSSIKDISKREARLESDLLLSQKRKLAVEKRADDLFAETERLRKELAESKVRFDKEGARLNFDLKNYVALAEKQKESYEKKIRKLLSEDAKKEVAYKAKVEELKELIERQNFLILQKERKEKEIVDDISQKFAEIFALRKEISTVTSRKDFDEFLGRDEFLDEELNNIVALFKRGLEHNDSIPNIKKSLVAAGFERNLVDKASAMLEEGALSDAFEDEKKKD